MKPILAIINTRVSTTEQLENNSLNRQLESVEKAAHKLGAVIPPDGRWSGSVSSKAGTNTTRKDLLEMLEYCRRHKNVKYAIFDGYDRYMRSVNEGPYFEVLFQQLGVKVWYAGESDTFNGDDAMAKFMRSMSAFKAEGSNEERQRKSISGHEKAIREGRYTFPPKPGYAKGSEPGVHVPYPLTFEPLKDVFKSIAAGLCAPADGLKHLNQSTFTKKHAPWTMDKFRRFAIDPYYAGTLNMDRQVKATNPSGRHEAMLTIDEHNELVRIFTGKFKPRGPHAQYNPAFPMNKIMVCDDCGGEVKFTGSIKNNGYSRKNTKYYWKYECRQCHRSYHRSEVHDKIAKRLGEITYTGSQQNQLVDALETVWRQKQENKLLESKALRRRLDDLQATKSSLIRELANADITLKEDIAIEIEKIKNQVAGLECDIQQLRELDNDLAQFIKFGLNYTNDLVEDWWDLSYEDRVQCQQTVLPGGISFNSQKKVGTPKISPLYTLKPNKKDLWFTQKSLMVELAEYCPPRPMVYLASFLQV